ncbi:MAG TPA: class I SAM-dependent methyltransferase [Pyrinomonadaceae bacterium]|jgi:SAM-dependent methyltransferase|nr:class I SAM-dependent methyltransferase [Pyrinomonadaceae bacterium]
MSSSLANEIASLSPAQRAALEAKLSERRNRPAAPAPAAFSDEENRVLTESQDSVDGLLATFYKKFPWPWQPVKFDYLEDREFGVRMLNQDLGDFTHRSVPRDARIWVAGCGTNQALHTALKYPDAQVIGSDLSTKSLELCARNARELGVTNLEVREESLNHVPYREQFDVVISTGVIHHNADPGATLEKLAAALKPDGVMEMMVYNRYQRITTSTFQKAVRVFGEQRGGVDFDADFALAKKVAANLPKGNALEQAFVHTQYMDWSDSDFADLFIHPVEHSYTVESLGELADACGLEYVAPCISLYAKSVSNAFSWNMQFDDPELRAAYAALPDARRWQVTNLLLFDKSPLLWFYLRRKDSAAPLKTERQVCEEFLDTAFEKAKTKQRSFIRDEEGHYRPSPSALDYPVAAPPASVRAVYELADGGATMRDIFGRLGLDTSFETVNLVRIQLTTLAFPYLKAVGARAS